MPPKARITRDMVVSAAFEAAREAGWEQINARTVSQRLNCSTQPVMYHFATIEELKSSLWADERVPHGISDERSGNAGGRHAWNWAELYPLCG